MWRSGTGRVSSVGLTLLQLLLCFGDITSATGSGRRPLPPLRPKPHNQAGGQSRPPEPTTSSATGSGGSTLPVLQPKPNDQASGQSRPPDPTTWEDAIQAGTGLLGSWNSGDTIQSEFTSLTDLATWGWNDITATGSASRLKTYKQTIQVSRILKDSEYTADFASSWSVWRQSGWAGQVSKEVEGTNYKATNGEYFHYMIPEVGAMFVTETKSPETAARLRANSAGRVPWQSPLPKLREWSDVAFLLWKDRCAQRNKPTSSLKVVYYIKSADAETSSIIKEALQKEQKELRGWSKATFPVSSDTGKALLGSPVGKSVAALLLEHKDDFAGISVDKIMLLGPGTHRAVSEGSPLSIAFHIAGTSGDDHAQPATGSKRPADDEPGASASKKVLLQSWADAIKWTDELEADVMAEQSEFVSYDELAKWGWHQQKDEDGLDASTVKAPFAQLGVRGLVREKWVHSGWGGGGGKNVQVGRTWDFDHPSGAEFYQSMSADNKVIVVDKIITPRMAGEAQHAGGPALGPQPKLYRWSDVAFLLWEKHCNSPKKTEELEWIFMVGIDDKVTLEIIEEAIGGSWLNIRGWPGKNFKKGSTQWNALFGSPVGQNAAELVARHVHGFPAKYIDAIAVYDPAAEQGEHYSPQGTAGWLHDRFPVIAVHIADGLASSESPDDADRSS